MYYEVNLVTRKRNFYKNFESVTRSVTSFCVTQFRNSRIPKHPGHRTISINIQRNFVSEIDNERLLFFRNSASFWNVCMCVAEVLITTKMFKRHDINGFRVISMKLVWDPGYFFRNQAQKMPDKAMKILLENKCSKNSVALMRLWQLRGLTGLP